MGASSGSPSGTKVLVQDPARYNTMSTEQAWLTNPVTVGGSWGSRHTVDLDVKRLAWGTAASQGASASSAGGPKVFMGKQSDAYVSNNYTVELDIYDGKAYVKKKVWDRNDCGVTVTGGGGRTYPPDGNDPRAIDCAEYGDGDGNFYVATWYALAEADPGSMSGGVWHHFRAVKQDNPDGSVVLTGYRDGRQLVQATENTGAYDPQTNPNGRAGVDPLVGGREGWRSNASNWEMDNFDVARAP